MYIIEVRNADKWQEDKKKCCTYINALKTQVIEKTFNYDAQARIVFVYEYAKHTEKLKRWAANDELFQHSNHAHQFYIASLESLLTQPYKASLEQLVT